MVSLLTNHAAITALQNLTATNRALEMTQQSISTGLRVRSAADNAAYWSISTTMQSDNKALSTVKDALALGSATIDVASSALTSAKDVVSDMKARLVAAREPGIDRGKIQKEIAAMEEQLRAISSSASFSGQNWLSVDSTNANYNATKSVVASFSRDTSGAIAISKIDIDIGQTKLFDAGDQSGILDKSRTFGSTSIATADIDISALTDSPTDMTTLDDYINITSQTLDDMINAASDLGAAKNRVSQQQGFVGKLSDAITTGVGALIDADMNEASTRLQALQTQQSLGVQSLSIANQSTQTIMQLFRGG